MLKYSKITVCCALHRKEYQKMKKRSGKACSVHQFLSRVVFTKVNVAFSVPCLCSKHTVILEYFNIEEFHFLILPSSLFRYSYEPQTKRIFECLWRIFEIFSFVHFYPHGYAHFFSFFFNTDNIYLNFQGSS